MKMTLYVVDGDEERWYDDPDEILEALAEAGVLDVQEALAFPNGRATWSEQPWWFDGPHARYVSPWKEAK